MKTLETLKRFAEKCLAETGAKDIQVNETAGVLWVSWQTPSYYGESNPRRSYPIGCASFPIKYLKEAIKEKTV